MNQSIVSALLGKTLDVPRQMQGTPRWLRWKLVKRGERWTKMPITLSGRPASVKDPDTWADYFDALWTPKGDGIGFVLGEGIGCIDLDNALTEEGTLTAWAEKILARAPETFMEVSHSGRGLHIWGLLEEAPGRNLRTKGMSVEVYSGGQDTGRYIALGSTPWPDSVGRLADITELAEELTA